MKKNLQETLAEALGSRSVKKRAGAFEELLASNLAPEEKAKIARQLLNPDDITDPQELAQYQEKLAWECRKGHVGAKLNARVEVCKALFKTSDYLPDENAQFQCRCEILNLLYKGEKSLRPAVLAKTFEAGNSAADYVVRTRNYLLLVESLPVSNKLGQQALDSAWGISGNLSPRPLAALCSRTINCGPGTPFYSRAYETLAAIAPELPEEDSWRLKAYRIVAGCPIEGNLWREEAFKKAMAMIGAITDMDDKVTAYERLAWNLAPVRFGGDTTQIDTAGRAMMALAREMTDSVDQREVYMRVAQLPVSKRLENRAREEWERRVPNTGLCDF